MAQSEPTIEEKVAKLKPIDVNPATSAILTALGAMHSGIAELVSLAKLGGRADTAGIFRVSSRRAFGHALRVREWVIAGGAAGSYALQVGTATVATVEFAAAETLVVPLPIGIDRGQDIETVASGGGTVTDSFLIAYTE